jgi:hypothetical protein
MTDVDSPTDLETAVASTRGAASEALSFAKLEGRIHTLEGQVNQLLVVERGRKQRALYYRLALLALMLLGFYVLRLRQGSTP